MVVFGMRFLRFGLLSAMRMCEAMDSPLIHGLAKCLVTNSLIPRFNDDGTVLGFRLSDAMARTMVFISSSCTSPGIVFQNTWSREDGQTQSALDCKLKFETTCTTALHGGCNLYRQALCRLHLYWSMMDFNAYMLQALLLTFASSTTLPPRLFCR